MLGVFMLFLKAELCDDSVIALRAFTGQVVQEGLTLRNHLQEAAAGVVVFRMCFEVFHELLDLVGQDGDLHFSRTSIAVVEFIFYYNFFFFLGI